MPFFPLCMVALLPWIHEEMRLELRQRMQADDDGMAQP